MLGKDGMYRYNGGMDTVVEKLTTLANLSERYALLVKECRQDRCLLRKVRMDCLKLTQEGLARRLGLSQSHLAHIEAGRRMLPIRVMIKLARLIDGKG